MSSVAATELIQSENFQAPDANYRWSPVSPQYPVHIRPLGKNGFELALHVQALPSLQRLQLERPDNSPEGLVRAVMEAVLAVQPIP